MFSGAQIDIESEFLMIQYGRTNVHQNFFLKSCSALLAHNSNAKWIRFLKHIYPPYNFRRNKLCLLFSKQHNQEIFAFLPGYAIADICIIR